MKLNFPLVPRTIKRHNNLIGWHDANVVTYGMKDFDVTSYKGRPCIVVNQQRIRRKEGWGFFNSLSVVFIDNGDLINIPAGKFNQKRRN